MKSTTTLTLAFLLAGGLAQAALAAAPADAAPLTYKDVQAAQKKSTKQGDVVFDPFEGRPIRLALTPIGKSAANYYYVVKTSGIIFNCIKSPPGYAGGDTIATVVGTNANEGISMQLTGCRSATP